MISIARSEKVSGNMCVEPLSGYLVTFSLRVMRMRNSAISVAYKTRSVTTEKNDFLRALYGDVIITAKCIGFAEYRKLVGKHWMQFVGTLTFFSFS